MNTRHFRVRGEIACLFSPSGVPPVVKHISSISVELWHKAPLEVILLGRALTDDNGVFVCDFEIDSPISFIEEGKIEDVFIECYYKDRLINEMGPIDGLVLNEGYTDIGTKDIEITDIEIPEVFPLTETFPLPDSSQTLSLFRLEYLTGEEVPTDFIADFIVYDAEGNVFAELSSNPNSEGYIQINTPILPLVVKKVAPNETVIKYDITGPLDQRSEECYLKVIGTSGTPLYTLIWDIVIHDNFLKVKDGGGNYYTITPEIELKEWVAAVYINEKGDVYGYDADAHEWSQFGGPFEFNMIEFPEHLVSVTDGFYETTPGSGTITPGSLGSPSTPFEEFIGTVTNPEVYYLKTSLTVHANQAGLPPVFSGDFIIMPGSLNYVPVSMSGSPPSIPDTSPTLNDIETVSGVTFGTVFLDFLTTNNLTTTDKIRKAGPLTYVDGYPVAGITPPELDTLQGHVDLYSINENLDQNQRLISEGYGNIYTIANTPKDIFLTNVVDSTLPLFKAAEVHEVASQNLKLVGNLLSGTLADLQLTTPATPALANSNFVPTALASSINSCGCDDCKSAISPFAYLMDLIRYAAAHVKHTASPIYNPGDSLSSFISLISNTFLQPFGTLNVNCSTLNDEYCRVRLTTEVLEKWLDVRITNSLIPPTAGQITALGKERNQFFTLTYQSLLKLAGTSLDELRDVVTASPIEAKTKLAQALSNKLGIPLYIAPTTNFSIDRLYLTLNNTNPLNVLNAANLENVFGFRNTKRNVLTPTPVSLIEQLRSTYLRDQWKIQDYLFNDFSREGVNPASDPTFKSNWLPIIDPDNIGWIDFTYNPYKYAKAIWERRKEDTDAFLTDWSSNPLNIIRSAADIKNQILKVSDRNIVTHVIENDFINIYNGVNWNTNFEILNRTLIGTNTDVILKKSTIANPQPPFFQPQDVTNPPKMRYKRVINVISAVPQSVGPFALNWTDPVIQDQIGSAKLTSDNDSTIFQTSDGSIVSVSFDNEMQVTLTLNAAPNANFVSGNIKFTYEVEVPLVYEYVLNPASVTTRLFTVAQSYTLLPTTPTSNPALPVTFSYPATNNAVWNLPNSWIGNYSELKDLYQKITLGTATEVQLAIVTDDLYMSLEAFNRMMSLLIKCENYLAATYTNPAPSNEEIFELVSIFRISAKEQLKEIWVKEEIKHWEDNTSNPIILRLDSQYFWKSIEEPISGSWDPSLQTIPANTANINSKNISIIDPELLSKSDLNQNSDISVKAYRDLYDSRLADLQAEHDFFLSLLLPINANGYEESLNYINNDDENIPYDITPYTSLQSLVDDLQSNDAFKVKEAAEVTWNAFRINREDFLYLADIKERYEANDPGNVPILAELEKTIKIMVSGYKRIWFYGDTAGGWIYDEVLGNFTNGTPVFYYNVMKMKLAPGRSSLTLRADWQRTLAAWNRQAFIQPDLVPPENIKNFVNTNWVYTTWNGRKTALNNDNATLALLFNSTLTAGALLNNLENQINLVIGRFTNFTNEPLNYLPYFNAVANIEEQGEDIRPVLSQLGIGVTEYRFLRKVYDVLESTMPPSSPSPLVESEYNDIIDILIHIRSGYKPFSQVTEEYNNNIILSQDFFKIYKPAPVNFPLSNLPEFNKWRSPYSERKAWLDTLQTRIERESSVIEKWKDILLDAEEQNMPLMRDALIRALTNNCENWQDAAERIAKSFFIETKDNCCVKHTRVSFAIETLQGLLFALETGVYDDFIMNFALTAPNFKEEWKWIGSYATWRSAMFVFLFPENLLYPTLKRFQTSQFVELSSSVSNANRLTPIQACKEAEKFENYFSDISYIRLYCSTNVEELRPATSSNVCCDRNETELKRLVYYFGEGQTGDFYYCVKEDSTTPSDTLGSWIKLPIPQSVNLIGCFAYTQKNIDDVEVDKSLVLFYSTINEGVFKLFFIRKVVSVIGADWEEPHDCELPSRPGKSVARAIACANIIKDEIPGLLFSFSGSSGYESLYFKFNLKESKFDTPSPTTGVDPAFVSQGFKSAIILPIKTTNQSFINRGLVAVTNLNKILFRLLYQNNGSMGTIDTSLSVFTQIIGLYQTNQQNTFVVFDKVSSVVYVKHVTVNSYISNGLYTATASIVTTPLTDSAIQTAYSIYPVFGFNELYQPYLALETFSARAKIGARITLTGNSKANLYLPFDLAPVIKSWVSLVSGDCIADMNARAISIKDNILYNNNSPLGTSSYIINRTQAVRQLLAEAYYFVPMLLGLDQQRRGQYDAALSWYQSVYDYTNPLVAKRKIFYGLVLEESITTTFLQAPNWLLDPLNPHYIAQTRANAYTKYTLMSIIQCFYAYADREFTLDTIETVPRARKLYTSALDLLKTKELNLLNNQCIALANGCLDTQTDLSTNLVWGGLYAELKGNLAEIGSVSIIESLAHDIADVLNSGTEDTYASKFAEAFEMIEAAMPLPPADENVSEFMAGNPIRINDASRYLFALNNPLEFNNTVSDLYTNSIANIIGVSVEEISSTSAEQKLQWLYDPNPVYTDDYTFAFAASDGEQFMSGDKAYNPLAPTEVSFDANLVFSNAKAVSTATPIGPNPVPYTPLIDFKFCTPKNPIYNSLELKGNLELYKIFNCRNIAGMVRELSVFAAATDSTTGVPVIGASGNLVLPGANNFAPTQYRFKALLERAKQIAQQAAQLESLFLAALEKEDAENYAQLRARQDLATARATVKLQDLRITQANNERSLADLQLGKVTFIQGHYNNLISSGLNGFELQALDLLNQSINFLRASQIAQGVSAGLYISQGVWFANTTRGAESLGSFAAAAAGIAGALGTQSSIFSIQSSIASQMASYERRQEEWQFQSQLAGLDISIANQQIKIADDNVRIVSQEREIAVLNTNHAQDALEFLRNKFTNAELYNWMGNILERAYSYMLNLSTATARTAENQLYFERQEQAGPFILDDYWELPSAGFTGGTSNGQPERRGLTGSARLLVDIQRLDQFAFETNKRKLQMTKTISLAQNFPSEFQQFKETGVLYFELTNKLFDYDFPGHYLRLINNVKTTVVGLLPVYDSIKATLSAEPTSYTVIGGTTFQKISIRRLEVDSVALTSANNATGLFELQPIQNSELLNPFEGMGIESRWEFKMPEFSNHLDYSNIADVVISVDYTALDSFQYRYQVLQDLDNQLLFNRGFSFKNNFPDQWYELGEAIEGSSDFGVTFELKREMFPQGVHNLQLDGTDIVLYFVRKDGFVNEIDVLDFNLDDPQITNTIGGETNEGKFPTTGLMTALGNSPLHKFRLKFDNNPINRELFSDGNIQDILLLVGCKAELKTYPL
ncbi:MAG: hypothetical protein IPM51_06980 [Sphingobacteriaceae bacterium]|nr:hypothetical protein [Sphingobacteriaceae bacterium]